MAYVPVPKDLSNVKTKVAFGLTKRQLICFSIAAGAGIPVYFLTRRAIGNTPAVLLMIGIMMPFFFFALYEKDGQPAEKILRMIIRQKMSPENRPYVTQNTYKYLSKKEGYAIGQKKKAGNFKPSRKAASGTGNPQKKKKGKGGQKGG